MTAPDTPFLWFPAVAALGVGLALGLAFFASLRRNVQFYTDGRPLAGVVLHLLRVLLVAAVLVAAVQFGAVPLLACALGFLIGRHLVLRRVEREP